MFDVYRFVAAIALLALFLPAVPAVAQDDTDMDLASAYDKAVRSIDTGKFDEGIAVVDTIISEYSSGAIEDFGPVFGHFYYIKGILLIRKKQYQAAIAPLKICYEKYNNDVLKKKVDPEDTRLPNRFHIHALVQWAGCELALEKYADAATRYERALAEDPRTEPPINRLEVQINLAKCYILSDRVAKGRDFLLSLLDAETLTDPTKRMIFMILVNNWAPLATTEEIRDVLYRYGDLIRNEELLSRHERNRYFAAQAGIGFEKDDPVRALLWYGMMGHPGSVMEHYSNRIASLKGRVVEDDLKPQLDAKIAELEKEMAPLRKEYASMMLGIGAAHYQMESLSGSRATYKVLADNFPEIKQRPVILHNLVVCAVNLGRWKEAYQYGMIFFKEFPDHELKPSVARVLVEVIFLQEEYAEAHRVSVEVREDMPLGSDIRDIPDFVAGGSLYHLGRYEEAEVELGSYLENYPEGKRLEMVKFYFGASKVNLFKWQEGAVALDDFLENYPGSAMRPTALYLSGLAHLVLEDWDRSLLRIRELHTHYDNAPEIPASWNVKGDGLAGKGEATWDEISACHLEAKRLVEEDGRGDNEVAGYALRQLITGANDEEEWERSGAWFDEFMKRYQATAWRTDAIVGALPALVKLDRKDEGRTLLEELVNEVGDRSGDPQLDELVGSYIDFLRENYTVEETIARLNNFPADPSPPPAPLRAWMAMGEIEVLKKADPDENKDQINQAFYRLSALHEGGNLSNYTMVRLARWNLEERDKPADAEKIYDFILRERPQGEAVGWALVDTGKILSARDTTNSRQEAYGRFERVLNEVDRPGLREEAILGIARLKTRDEKWEEAQEWWEKYLENRAHNLARPEANYSYALCLDNLGKEAEAMKAYVNVYVIHAGHFDWSTKAYLRAANMRKDDGELVDALKILQDMLQRMGHEDTHPGVIEAKKLFDQWRNELAAAGGAPAQAAQ